MKRPNMSPKRFPFMEKERIHFSALTINEMKAPIKLHSDTRLSSTVPQSVAFFKYCIQLSGF